MLRTSLHIGAGLAAMSLGSAASAAISFGNISPTKSPSGDFIPGNGIHADSFTIDTAITGESAGLAVRNRSDGNATSIVGNRYHVNAGTTNSGTRTAWQFEFQFSPGVVSTKASTDYKYEIQFDTNPAAGAATFSTIAVPGTIQAQPIGDSYYPTGTGGSVGGTPSSPTYGYSGSWSDATPWVVANSQNYAFSHFLGSSFTNPAGGEYDLIFTVRDALTDAVVVSTNVVAVVPEPGAVALIALGAGALLLRRRRGRVA